MTRQEFRSTIKARGLRICERRTSVALEDDFWQALAAIAAERGVSRKRLVEEIMATLSPVGERGLSSKIRLFVLDHFRRRVSEKVPNASRHAEISDRGASNK